MNQNVLFKKIWFVVGMAALACIHTTAFAQEKPLYEVRLDSGSDVRKVFSRRWDPDEEVYIVRATRADGSCCETLKLPKNDPSKAVFVKLSSSTQHSQTGRTTRPTRTNTGRTATPRTPIGGNDLSGAPFEELPPPTTFTNEDQRRNSRATDSSKSGDILDEIMGNAQTSFAGVPLENLPEAEYADPDSWSSLSPRDLPSREEFLAQFPKSSVQASPGTFNHLYDVVKGCTEGQLKDPVTGKIIPRVDDAFEFIGPDGNKSRIGCNGEFEFILPADEGDLDIVPGAFDPSFDPYSSEYDAAACYVEEPEGPLGKGSDDPPSELRDVAAAAEADCELNGDKDKEGFLKSITCNILRTFNPGSYLRRAAEGVSGVKDWIVSWVSDSKKKTETDLKSTRGADSNKNCFFSMEPSCMSSLVDGFLKNIVGTITGLIDLAAAAIKNIPTALQFLWGITPFGELDEATTEALGVAMNTAEAEISKFSDDPAGWIAEKLSNFADFIWEEGSKAFACEQYGADPKTGEPVCTKYEQWAKCTTWDQYINIICGSAGFILPEFAGAGGFALAKVFKIGAGIGKVTGLNKVGSAIKFVSKSGAQKLEKLFAKARSRGGSLRRFAARVNDSPAGDAVLGVSNKVGKFRASIAEKLGKFVDEGYWHYSLLKLNDRALAKVTLIPLAGKLVKYTVRANMEGFALGSGKLFGLNWQARAAMRLRHAEKDLEHFAKAAKYAALNVEGAKRAADIEQINGIASDLGYRLVRESVATTGNSLGRVEGKILNFELPNRTVTGRIEGLRLEADSAGNIDTHLLVRDIKTGQRIKLPVKNGSGKSVIDLTKTTLYTKADHAAEIEKLKNLALYGDEELRQAQLAVDTASPGAKAERLRELNKLKAEIEFAGAQYLHHRFNIGGKIEGALFKFSEGNEVELAYKGIRERVSFIDFNKDTNLLTVKRLSNGKTETIRLRNIGEESFMVRPFALSESQVAIRKTLEELANNNEKVVRILVKDPSNGRITPFIAQVEHLDDPMESAFVRLKRIRKIENGRYSDPVPGSHDLEIDRIEKIEDITPRPRSSTPPSSGTGPSPGTSPGSPGSGSLDDATGAGRSGASQSSLDGGASAPKSATDDLEKKKAVTTPPDAETPPSRAPSDSGDDLSLKKTPKKTEDLGELIGEYNNARREFLDKAARNRLDKTAEANQAFMEAAKNFEIQSRRLFERQTEYSFDEAKELVFQFQDPRGNIFFGKGISIQPEGPNTKLGFKFKVLTDKNGRKLTPKLDIGEIDLQTIKEAPVSWPD